jgi:hypothetical protein
MTAIFDVVVNTDDLVVLAPPTVIDVGVDFGPQGKRGATFYAGSGDPNDVSVQQILFGDLIVPVDGDIYIKVDDGGDFENYTKIAKKYNAECYKNPFQIGYPGNFQNHKNT